MVAASRRDPVLASRAGLAGERIATELAVAAQERFNDPRVAQLLIQLHLKHVEMSKALIYSFRQGPRPLDAVASEKLEHRQAGDPLPVQERIVARQAAAEYGGPVDHVRIQLDVREAAAGACRADSARPTPGQRAVCSAGTPTTASAISR